MKLYTAYKFRIYPNDEQKIKLSKTFGCVRFVYNNLLRFRFTMNTPYRISPKRGAKIPFF